MNDTSLLRPNNDAERTFEVFFYGLHMDPCVLVSKGVVPRDPRVAFVDDHVVRLGAKAMLLRSHGGRAYGMLFRLTHPEMDALYADAHDYRPEAFSVTVVNPAAGARPTASISMVHRAPPIDSAEDPDYRIRWKSIVRRLGIPVDAVRFGNVNTMLKILGKSSSINVRKVLWLCAEMDLAYEHEQWGSGFRPTDVPEFLALNPNAMVPVIQDGSFVLWESNTICRYLASRDGRSDLLPVHPQDRARVEQWVDWQATELNNAWRYAFMALVRKSPAHADPRALAASIAHWNRHMQMLDAQLARTGAYAAGATFTLADVVLGLSTNRWVMTPMERPHLPAVQAYFERLSQRPAFLLHGRNGTP